jgi:hypothetical protein
MTTSMFALIPVLLCLAFAFGAVAIVWLAKTPLGRVPWIARRAQAHEGADS